MVKKLAGIIFLSVISFSAVCQSTEAKRVVARPDIPGIFNLEFGLNRDAAGPEEWKTGLFGTRSLNIYYQYEFRIMKSKISVVPGIGFSLERFKFRDFDILRYPADNTDSVLLVPPTEHLVPSLRKSQLITNYIDLPIEFRYTSNPDDPARSFKVAIGGRVGYMIDAFTKIKYKEDGEIKQIKDKQNFNLNRLRYGISARIGLGNISLVGYYNLSPLFKENEGFYNNGAPINFSTFTVGLSLASF